MHPARLEAADLEDKPVIAHTAPQHRRAQDNRRPGRFGLALEGQHQRVAVDDAGDRRQQCGHTAQFRFEPLRLFGAQPFEFVDAVRSRRRVDLFELRDLGLVGGDDQLAERGVRHPVLAAVVI